MYSYYITWPSLNEDINKLYPTYFSFGRLTSRIYQPFASLTTAEFADPGVGPLYKRQLKIIRRRPISDPYLRCLSTSDDHGTYFERLQNITHSR